MTGRRGDGWADVASFAVLAVVALIAGLAIAFLLAWSVGLVRRILEAIVQ